MSIFQEAIERTDGKTLILSNGSKWAGQNPDSIDTLLGVLDTEMLDPVFEQYHCYQPHRYEPALRSDDSDINRWVGAASYFGNFRTVSHVFNIITFDQEVIDALNKAIRKNVESDEYQKAAYIKYADWFYARLDGQLELMEAATVKSIREGTLCRFRYSSTYERLCRTEVLGPRFIGETPQPLPQCD